MLLPLRSEERLLSYGVPVDGCDISVDATVADDGRVSGGRMGLSEECLLVALCLLLLLLVIPELLLLASAGRDGEAAANELASAQYVQLSATRRYM